MVDKFEQNANPNSQCRLLRTAIRRGLMFLVVLVCFVGPTTQPAEGQSDEPAQTVGVTLATQLPVENGFINAVNGDLHLEIPLGSWPQRDGRNFTATLMYDSNIWDYYEISGPTNVPDANYCGYFGCNGAMTGWRLVSSADQGGLDYVVVDSTSSCKSDGNPMYQTFEGFTWIAPDGTSHSFPGSVREELPNNCNGSNTCIPSASGLAIDASGYHLNVTDCALDFTVLAPDGSLVSSGGTRGVEDPNGNYYSGTSAGATIVDSLKRTLVTTTTSGNYIYYDVLNSQGSTSRYTVTTETINVQECFYTPYFTFNSVPVIQQIQLPDGTSYSFTYDSGTSCNYGELASMQLPTGATIDYSYTNILNYQNYAAPIRYVSSRSTPDGTWNYSLSANNSTCVHPNGYWANCQASFKVTKPSNAQEVYTFELNGGAWPVQAQYYDSSSKLLETITQSFDLSNTCSQIDNDKGECPWGMAIDVTRQSATATFPVPGGSVSAATNYAYDTSSAYGSLNYGNLMQMSEWNFGSNTSNPADRNTTYTYLNGSSYISANILDRPASVTVSGSTGTVAQTTYCYDYASGCGGSSFANVSSVAQHDATYGTSYSVRGDLTQENRLVSGTTNFLTKSTTYDITGQKLTETDWSNSHATAYDYTDNFYNDGGNTPTHGGQNNPSTPTNAYVTTVTLPNSMTIQYGYYWGTGQKAYSTDPNSQTTYFHFYDSLNRPTSTLLPNMYNSSCCGWTYEVYPNDSETQVDEGTGITSATLSVSCTAGAGDCRHDRTLLDTSGRLSTQELLSDPDCSSGTKVDTAYDSDGRVFTVSNPYCSTSDPTYGVETYYYDGLDRKAHVNRADGSSAYTYYGAAIGSSGGNGSQMCSGYGVGYPILNIDEAGNLRQTWTDGFGRLIEVDEPDPSSGSLTSGSPTGTCYSYDLNNNLTGVAEGSQTRSFSYDMLSRLTAATNPESNTTYFCYGTGTSCSGTSSTTLCSGDPGAICLRTDARGITTTYSYVDSLNRLTGKSYSDGTTPSVTLFYDQNNYNGLTIANGKDRLTGMSDGSGETAKSYDPIGNTLEETRRINSITENVIYAYNLDSTVASIEYPSTRKVTYAPGGAQRPFSAIDTADSISYGQLATYAPHGALSSLTNGASSYVWSTLYYNKRLQPCRIAINTSGTAPSSCSDSNTGNIMDLQYNFDLSSTNSFCSTSFGAPSNNGSVASTTDNLTSSRSQTFCYDKLNRIYQAAASTYATSSTNCWGEQFTVDRWGNMSNIGAIAGTSAYNGCTQENVSLAVSSNNQFNGFCYDSDGNLTETSGAPTCPSPAYTYNAENQLTSAGGVTYTYDGDGNRVEKSSGVLYWYGTSSEPLAETDANGNTTNEFVFLQNRRIARRDSSGNVFYYFADQLGTARKIVQAGSTSPCYDADFYPYGGERIALNGMGDPIDSCDSTYKFTGKERDSESALDDFGARYSSSSIGRFMSPDPSNLSVDFEIPQTWNRYSYVLNNPLQMVDRNGEWPTSVHNEIIKNAFEAVLSAQDRKTLSDASYKMDYGHGQQSPENAYMHGMSNGPLYDKAPLFAVYQAEVQANAYISDQEQQATALQADWIESGHTGFAPAALTAFGNALHTITDSLSPAHAGYQPWYSVANVSNIGHYWKEHKISSEQMKAATSVARQAFKQTFGMDEFDLLKLEQGTRPGQVCVMIGDTRNACQDYN